MCSSDLVARVAFLLGLMVVGLALFLLLPNFTASAARTIRTDPWKSLGLGFAVLVATPVAGLLLMVTLLGIPLALTVFALYLVSLLLGYLTAVFFLGETGAGWLRRGRELSGGERVLGFVAALVALSLLRLIPVLGVVVAFLALVFGLGAWSLQAYRAWKTP